MGALHEGHLAMISECQKHSDICLPYIFLNPKQFAEDEDLDKYPKTLEADLEKLDKLGIENVYVPNIEEIYPEGFQTTVSVADIAQPLEGEHRPGFFNGVTTVVAKMLIQCLPDIVVLGEKDFQQLKVIERMVKDLNIPVKILPMPTIRDENGLALSSRNQYLSEAQYNIAIQMNKILSEMALGALSEQAAIQKLLDAGFDKIDYCTARNGDTFLPQNPNRVLAAAWIGKTRLIDNFPIFAK
jgi:pantoate--beta-alanine ligase